ncbi:MAG: DnaJ domain-containing protein [Myxococcales bacterium]|nr:DnaJ domain-containing protein [Myxococcales bacterium]
MSKRRGKRDYYDVLGVGKKADDTELKRAYRDLARRYHPDLNPGPKAEERFKEINEAYAVVSDGKLRQRYDRYGHSAVNAGESGGGFDNVVDAFDDLISDILRRRKKPKERGKDLRYTLEISLEEAAFGCEKSIKIPNTTGKEREFVVTVPVASEDGAIRRIRNEGGTGENGGAPGDLHVILRVKSHPVMRREGSDVWCEVPVTFPQAAMGAVVEIPSLDGKVRMRVPEGTQSGRILRMRGKGMPKSSSKSASRGDHMVRIVVETPTNLTDSQRRLLERFSEEEGGAIQAHPQRQGFMDKLRSLFRD